MKISEFLVSYLVSLGVDSVFGVQGSGTAIQMFDALGEIEGIRYVCTLHEQAAGMAADAYAGITGNLGACVTTCGPGASNLYTAIAGSYYNSNPVLYIIGQPPVGVLSKVKGLRHYGYHENDLSIFKPVSKYVTQILDPKDARFEIEKAVYLATHGRPGPVVIALPDDITWLQIDPNTQKNYTPEEINRQIDDGELQQVLRLFEQAERPLIIAGKGVICSGAIESFKGLISLINCPVALTWGAKDIFPFDDNHNTGSFGVQGTRSGNFAVQNADLVLSIGTRLDPSETGVPQSNFARSAKIISVDIDKYELNKYQVYGLSVYKTIYADANDFIQVFCKYLEHVQLPSYETWLNKILYWKQRYPVVLQEYYFEPEVNPYVFVEELSSVSGNCCIVTDTSTPRNYIFQSFKNKPKQRLYTWLNYACLGYGLPAGIGACFAYHGMVISIMGDGGLQFNIQELATVVYHNLNLKIFVFDNGGFANIYHVQNNYMDGRHHGIDRKHGLPMPDSGKIANAYGLPVIEIASNKEMHDKLKMVLGMNGPVFCIIKLPMSHWTVPRKVGKDPIEDMTPKLDRKEFYNEMIVEPIS